MIKKWLIGIVAILITVYVASLLPPTFRFTWSPIWKVIIFVPVLAITNAILGTILRLLSLPITCLTLGLIGFVINAIVFWIAGLATGAQMGFWSPLFGSICYTLISTPLSWVIKEKD